MSQKTEVPTTPKVEGTKTPAAEKFTEKVRKELLKVKVSAEKVKKLLAKGLSLWEVTETIYGRKFDHSNRKTWVFYQKVNNSRHQLGIATSTVKISPLTTIAINTFLEKHTEQELRELLVRTPQ